MNHHWQTKNRNKNLKNLGRSTPITEASNDQEKDCATICMLFCTCYHWLTGDFWDGKVVRTTQMQHDRLICNGVSKFAWNLWNRTLERIILTNLVTVEEAKQWLEVGLYDTRIFQSYAQRMPLWQGQSWILMCCQCCCRAFSLFQHDKGQKAGHSGAMPW